MFVLIFDHNTDRDTGIHMLFLPFSQIIANVLQVHAYDSCDLQLVLSERSRRDVL